MILNTLDGTLSARRISGRAVRLEIDSGKRRAVIVLPAWKAELLATQLTYPPLEGVTYGTYGLFGRRLQWRRTSRNDETWLTIRRYSRLRRRRVAVHVVVWPHHLERLVAFLLDRDPELRWVA